MSKIFQRFQCSYTLLVHLYVLPFSFPPFSSCPEAGVPFQCTVSVYRLPIQNSVYDCTIDRNNTQIQTYSHTESMKKTAPPIQAVPFFQIYFIKFYSTYPYKKLYNLRKRHHTLLTQPLSTSTHTHHTPSAGKFQLSLILPFSADKMPRLAGRLLY